MFVIYINHRRPVLGVISFLRASPTYRFCIGCTQHLPSRTPATGISLIRFVKVATANTLRVSGNAAPSFSAPQIANDDTCLMKLPQLACNVSRNTIRQIVNPTDEV